MAPGHPATRVTESVVVTMALPLLGYAIDRTDPFLLQHPFPWLVFAPLLVGLRHGFALGFGSAFALGAALILAWRTRLLPMTSFPGEPAVGLVALAMIAGQFADLWRREAARQRGELAELRGEADRLAREHLLLETSHERLRERVERTVGSLRDAVSAVTDLLSESASLAASGGAIMDVFADHCGVEIGELFGVERGRLGHGYATLGRPTPTRGDDPLVAQALRSGRITYVPVAPPPGGQRPAHRSPLLAAIPFVDGSGAVRAVLAVHAMPLSSFDDSNLDAMTAIAAAVADRLREAPELAPTPEAIVGGASA